MNHYTFLSGLKEGHHAQTQKLALHRMGMGGALAQHTKGMSKMEENGVGGMNSLRVKGLSRYSCGHYNDMKEESCLMVTPTPLFIAFSPLRDFSPWLGFWALLRVSSPFFLIL